MHNQNHEVNLQEWLYRLLPVRRFDIPERRLRKVHRAHVIKWAVIVGLNESPRAVRLTQHGRGYRGRWIPYVWTAPYNLLCGIKAWGKAALTTSLAPIIRTLVMLGFGLVNRARRGLLDRPLIRRADGALEYIDCLTYSDMVSLHDRAKQLGVPHERHIDKAYRD